jgi:hypothetical protein
MLSYFAGGAIGTAIASEAWSRGGWPAVCGAGAALALAGTVPVVLSSRAPPGLTRENSQKDR